MEPGLCKATRAETLPQAHSRAAGCAVKHQTQVQSVTQPIPRIQVASKSLKLSAFPGALLLAAQEQSEDEQLILVLLFHAQVLRACCFVLALSSCFLNS